MNESVYRLGRLCGLPGLFVCLLVYPSDAQERRSRPPKFTGNEFQSVFYEDVSQAVNSNRPAATELNKAEQPRQTAVAQAAPESSSSNGATPSGGTSKWRAMADPIDLEDEVKRQKLAFDALVTTPGRFKSGEYRDARTRMFVLSTVLAVIAEYNAEVRFKDDAPIARDSLSRSAVALTGDSFAEAKQRKADLQDLLGGGGLNRSAPVRPTDWGTVANRSALMQYLEELLDESLRSGANDAASFAENKTELKRAAAMVAIVGQALIEEGATDADDDDYRSLSEAMKTAGLDLRNAISRDDAEAARLAVGAIGQSCNACHEQYR